MPRFESASLVAIQVKFRLGLWLVPVYWCLFVINFFSLLPGHTENYLSKSRAQTSSFARADIL